MKATALQLTLQLLHFNAQMTGLNKLSTLKDCIHLSMSQPIRH